MPDAPIHRRFVTPTVEDAEAFQGFPRGWTDIPPVALKRGVRWKLTGNAVTTRVAEWVARNLSTPGSYSAESCEWTGTGSWPRAAWGETGTVHAVDVSEFPRHHDYVGLSSGMDLGSAPRLSHRAINGFQSRLLRGNLGRHPGFREDVAAYAELDTLSFA